MSLIAEITTVSASLPRTRGVPVIANYPPVTLEVLQARGKVSILQHPAQDNDFILIVEFDNAILPEKTYGDEWYEINLTVKVDE